MLGCLFARDTGGFSIMVNERVTSLDMLLFVETKGTKCLHTARAGAEEVHWV
jgi:hypothetical protein